MAESSIKVQLPAFTLSHSDASIEIRSDGKNLEQLAFQKEGLIGMLQRQNTLQQQ